MLALLLAPAAQAAAPANVPELVAWAKQHLSGIDDWPLLGFNALGLTLASPAGATLRPSGLVEGEIRQEYFEPLEFEGRIMRSMTARWSVDCPRQRYAILSMTLYARNNLRDRVEERTEAAPAWRARDALSGDVIDAMCDAVRNGERLDEPPSP